MVAALVVSVIVVVPLPVTLAGLNAAVTPAGIPLTENVTLPVNPFCPVTVTLYGVLLPAATLCEEGAAPSAKSGGSDTTRFTTEV
jgi:hypothetical protein